MSQNKAQATDSTSLKLSSVRSIDNPFKFKIMLLNKNKVA